MKETQDEIPSYYVDGDTFDSEDMSEANSPVYCNDGANAPVYYNDGKKAPELPPKPQGAPALPPRKK